IRCLLSPATRLFLVPFGKEQDEQIRDFTAYSVGTIRLQPDGWFFTSPFINFADKLYDFKFKPSDTVVMTYPKCGTTWTQEIIWTMKNNPDLNHPMADVSINTRSPFLDSDFLLIGSQLPEMDIGNPMCEGFAKFCPGKKVEDGIFLQIAEACPDPRTIKTHLPFSLLAKDLVDTCKIIY
ncbi:UNVERIFIED_CONTAM: hypothetical protein GTU68_064936, partial [Idotea baltica]|nr:hypothetical protein [Idotea baltica]